MDSDRIKGAAKEAKGTVKEAAGKVTANREIEAEVKVGKVAGETQRKIGEAKDEVRDALDYKK